jgi:regulator of cell morphogenesis and NO signaling
MTIDRGASGFDEHEAGIPELIARIVDHHHAFTRRALAEIAPLMAEVVRVREARHPALERIAALFEAMQLELETHLLKEESLVFPQMLALARGEATPTDSALRSAVRHPLNMAHLEHGLLVDLLGQMRTATGRYSSPADAGPAWAKLCRRLDELDRDLVVHMHLEDDCLFPRLPALDAKLAHEHAPR